METVIYDVRNILSQDVGQAGWEDWGKGQLKVKSRPPSGTGLDEIHPDMLRDPDAALPLQGQMENWDSTSRLAAWGDWENRGSGSPAPEADVLPDGAARLVWLSEAKLVTDAGG